MNELEKILFNVFGEKNRDEWIDLLIANEIPVGPVNDVAELLNDPYVVSELLQDLPGTKVKYTRNPIGVVGEPRRQVKPPPRLGEHNAEVFGT